MKKHLAVTLLSLLALLAAPAAAFAAPAAGPMPVPAVDEVIFGSDYTVASGQTVNGSLILLGGSLTVEKGGLLTGEAVVLGGNVDLAGTIGGSAILLGGEMNQAADAVVGQEMVVFGGNVHVAGRVGSNLMVFGGNAQLASTAVVLGDLVTPAGEAIRATGAVVGGNVVDQLHFNYPATPMPPIAPFLPDRGDFRDWGSSRGWGIGGDFVWLLFRSFAMATVALLVVLFAERHLRRVADTVVAQPATAGGYGLLGIILAGAATIGLSLTLILIPVAVLVPFVLVTAWAFGWIGLGLEVGRRMGLAFQANWSPALQATLGTFGLTFAAGAVSWLPCVGWLLGAMAGLAGLGAVIMTRFGSQDYDGGTPAAVEPPPALAAPRKRAAAKRSTARRSSR